MFLLYNKLQICYNSIINMEGGQKMKDEMRRQLVLELSKIFGKSIEKIILYGSVARGDDTPESDIDIAVILHDYTKEMYNDMMECLVEMDSQYNKVFSVLLIDYDKFVYWEDVIPFYKNINKEGVILWKAA